MKKADLMLLGCIFSLVFVIVGITYFSSTAIQGRIGPNYKTGVIITTTTSEYLIALHYSDDTAEGVLILQLRPKLFVSNKIVRYIYTAPRSMHLWRWILTHGDHVLYGETIDRDVKAGDNIQFIYVVD